VPDADLSGWAVVLKQLPYLLAGAFPNGPLAGAALTLWMALLACTGATVLGIGVAVLLDLAPAPLARAVRALLACLRAIPVLMLVFWAYFLLPMLAGVHVGEVQTVVLALALIGAAYIAQVMAAGFVAIGRSQRNAALALGMTPLQALWQVVLPQTLRAMLPSLGNVWVSLAKDTSLAYIGGGGGVVDRGNAGQRAQRGLCGAGVCRRGAAVLFHLRGDRKRGGAAACRHA